MILGIMYISAAFAKNFALYSTITSITLQSLFNVVLAELIRIALVHLCCV